MSGIYVHIPFCRKRCSYCDFHFSTTFSNYRSELINSIVQEIELRKHELINPVETIYLGGGTPSILTKVELESIFQTIQNSFRFVKQIEITMEVNPEDVIRENVSIWKSIGINRISIGLQSLKESDLEWMNRAHNSYQGFQAVELLKKSGFENISVDLIYGLPELTVNEWEQHLNQIIALDIQHISAYCLTVEKRTALNHFVRTGKLKTPSDDLQSDQFNLMRRVLSKYGFYQYEVSNFSKAGFESKHNSAYWQNKQYLGVGPAAHSYDGKERRWNVSNNTKYFKGVGKNNSWFETETLSKNEQWNELFMTGLRTTWGVQKAKISEFGGLSSSELKKISILIENKDLFETTNAFILSEKGMLKADGIASSFFRV